MGRMAHGKWRMAQGVRIWWLLLVTVTIAQGQERAIQTTSRFSQELLGLPTLGEWQARLGIMPGFDFYRSNHFFGPVEFTPGQVYGLGLGTAAWLDLTAFDPAGAAQQALASSQSNMLAQVKAATNVMILEANGIARRIYVDGVSNVLQGALDADRAGLEVEINDAINTTKGYALGLVRGNTNAAWATNVPATGTIAGMTMTAMPGQTAFWLGTNGIRFNNLSVPANVFMPQLVVSGTGFMGPGSMLIALNGGNITPGTVSSNAFNAATIGWLQGLTGSGITLAQLQSATNNGNLDANGMATKVYADNTASLFQSGAASFALLVGNTVSNGIIPQLVASTNGLATTGYVDARLGASSGVTLAQLQSATNVLSPAYIKSVPQYTILGKSSAGTGAAELLQVSTVLDWFGSTPGSTLIRGPGYWGVAPGVTMPDLQSAITTAHNYTDAAISESQNSGNNYWNGWNYYGRGIWLLPSANSPAYWELQNLNGGFQVRAFDGKLLAYWLEGTTVLSKQIAPDVATGITPAQLVSATNIINTGLINLGNHVDLSVVPLITAKIASATNNVNLAINGMATKAYVDSAVSAVSGPTFLSFSGTLTFSVNPGNYGQAYIYAPGAAVSDPVTLGIPDGGSPDAVATGNVTFTAWVWKENYVMVRCVNNDWVSHNGTGLFRVVVWKGL